MSTRARKPATKAPTKAKPNVTKDSSKQTLDSLRPRATKGLPSDLLKGPIVSPTAFKGTKTTIKKPTSNHNSQSLSVPETEPFIASVISSPPSFVLPSHLPLYIFGNSSSNTNTAAALNIPPPEPQTISTPPTTLSSLIPTATFSVSSSSSPVVYDPPNPVPTTTETSLTINGPPNVTYFETTQFIIATLASTEVYMWCNSDVSLHLEFLSVIQKVSREDSNAELCKLWYIFKTCQRQVSNSIDIKTKELGRPLTGKDLVEMANIAITKCNRPDNELSPGDVALIHQLKILACRLYFTLKQTIQLTFFGKLIPIFDSKVDFSKCDKLSQFLRFKAPVHSYFLALLHDPVHKYQKLSNTPVPQRKTGDLTPKRVLPFSVASFPTTDMTNKSKPVVTTTTIPENMEEIEPGTFAESETTLSSLDDLMAANVFDIRR